MNNSPLPEDDNYDPNVDIEQEIYDRLFTYREQDDLVSSQYNFEMRPYIYPDVE
jgi:hypothetical protein